MHNINTNDDLWPQNGECIRYIWPDTNPYFPTDLCLTENNEYRIITIRFLPCADSIFIQDDGGNFHWVELYKFSFFDQLEFYNEEI